MKKRRPYIDWLRGLAVVIMIEAHTIDAWTVTDDAVRWSTRFKLLQFLAGWAAPLFLFLAGVSVALAAASHMRKGKSVAEASRAVQRRGWQVFGLAYLFRLQSFMLSPTSSAATLLKVDILNVMGLAMVGAAWCWGRGRSARARALWLIVPAFATMVLAQYAPGWRWPLMFDGQFEQYVRFTWPMGNFPLFPWAGFVFAGTYLGRLVLIDRDAQSDRRFHLRLGLVGAVVVAAAYAGSFLPAVTPYSVFWLSSTSWFLIRIGAMLVMFAAAWIWLKRPRADHWSPMVLFGQTSLFVYWVHVEIVYGFPTYPLRHELSIRDALIAYALFTGAMLMLAIKWNQRTKGPLIPDYLRTPEVSS
jgi:uncharacterized membrane protein